MIAPGSPDPAGKTTILHVPRGDLAWLTEDGACIVYNEQTGRTHQLDAAASLVFTALLEQAMTPAALAGWLAARWQVPPEALDRESLARLLAALEEAGLIVQAPP